HPRFVPEVVRSTEQFPQIANGAQFPLYVVETDLAVFAAQLAAVDMSAVFDSGRVMFFCGPEAWEELTAFFIDHPWRALPFSPDGRPVVTLVRPDETPKAQAFFAAAWGHRQKALTSAVKDMAVHYPAAGNELRDRRLKTLFGKWFDGVQALYQSGGVLNTTAETSEMLAALEKQTGISIASPSRPQLPDKVRVLFMVSVFTTVLRHVIEDIAQALRRLGHETRIVKEPSAMDRLYPTAVVSALSEFKPDMIFQMDHLRREWPWVPKGIPHLTFIQDMVPALLQEHAGQSIGPNDFVLVDTEFKWWQEAFDRYRYPRQNFIHFPSCTNEETFKPSELSESDRAKYGSDVAVTTNIDLVPARAWETSVVENLRGFSHARLRDAMVYDMFQTVANAFYRLTPLEWLAPLGLDIKIWGKFPQETHPTLGKYFVGPAGFEELPKIYQASRITILGNHAGWRHYKTASVLASGGLPLVRFHPDSCEDIVDRETMMFKGPDDLREKVRYWLSHEEARLNEVRKWRA
ncbi:MAG: hypothetical protein RDV41_15885, partial [Planctomycetota bacterium]|nr:hypothetical protein [Planctomycetota bacterium]